MPDRRRTLREAMNARSGRGRKSRPSSPVPVEEINPDALTFRPVTRENRADFEALFSAPGAPKYCWCMAWRRATAEAKETDSASSKRQMMARINKGTPVGLLAYDADRPVAWVSVAPRDTFRKLGGSDATPEETVWSLVCFFVPRARRRQGMMRSLITAAIDHAQRNGATVLEAYPVAPDSPSYRFMGFVSVFAEAGFTEVGRAGIRRHVMRRPLN